MLSDRVIKWQMTLRVERFNLVCTEKNYPNYMYAAIGFQEVFFCTWG